MANSSDFNPNNEDLVINDLYNLAAAEIFRTYGHTVSINRKTLHKFGRNDDLGTSAEVINHLGIEPYSPSSNLITHYSSSDASDTQQIRVEGMALTNGLLSFVAQDIILDGQNKTAMSTPLARVTRIANIDSITATSGDVYVYSDQTTTGGIPDNLSQVGNVMPAEDQSTLYAGTSVAANNYLIITNVYGYLAKKSGGFSDLRLRKRKLDRAYRTVNVTTAGSSSPVTREFKPFYIVEPNSDVSILATGSSAGLDICAGFDGFFADIK